jgi:hypothetical protein
VERRWTLGVKEYLASQNSYIGRGQTRHVIEPWQRDKFAFGIKFQEIVAILLFAIDSPPSFTEDAPHIVYCG